MAIVVLIAGFAGHLMKNFAAIPAGSISHTLKLILDSLLQSLQLFTLTSRPDPGTDNWILVLARLGGALVAFSAIGKILLGVLALSRQRLRLATLRGHAVICGHGERGRLFAKARGESACAIVDSSDDPGSSSAPSARIQGDARDPSVLRAAGLTHADTVVIGTGSDERNLAIARAALDHLSHSRKQLLQIIVTLDDPGLTDAIEREETIVRPAGLPRPVAVHLFNPARAAAVSLLSEPAWARRALALGQARIGLAIIGASDTAIEVLLQFLRISPCCGLARPRIEIFAPAAQARNRLLARAPNLIHALDPQPVSSASTAPLQWAVELVLHDVDPTHVPVTSLLTAGDTKPGEWTAVIVAAASSTGNIPLALNIRREMRRLALPPCPIHVHAPVLTSLDPLLDAPPRTADPKTCEAEVIPIHAFGRLGELCVLHPQSTPRERLARQLHDAYRQRRLSDTSRPADASEANLQEWSALAETYRRANRRAADHLRTKWLSANLLAGRTLDAPGFPETLTPELLEALSAIEHDSWRIDRELDGWRHAAKRDNERQLHPDLTPYQDLSNATQEYDREQIRELWAFRPE